MNFTQLQERVRLELLRRIERGTLSVSLLARQTGLGQAHVSNFLRGRRGLSLGTLDKVLYAQRLQVTDLLPARREALGGLLSGQMGEEAKIPLVSAAVAIFDPYIRASIVQTMLPFPAEAVKGLVARCAQGRKQWERFVAVRISAEEALGMEPVVQAGSVVVLDRHYTSFQPYREGVANLYGARIGGQFLVRYAQFQAERVVLRPVAVQRKAEVIEVGAGETAHDALVGRVVVVVNEM
jgi:transcriptional regulator with XRE-family HTH domain